ncbi:unnamed protein product [Calypogeia fissa]
MPILLARIDILVSRIDILLSRIDIFLSWFSFYSQGLGFYSHGCLPPSDTRNATIVDQGVLARWIIFEGKFKKQVGMGFNKKSHRAKRKPAGRERITFPCFVGQAVEPLLKNVEHAQFVTNRGLKKFVSLKWKDDSVREDEMLEFVCNYDGKRRTTQIAGQEINLSEGTLDRIFGLPTGTQEVQQRARNYVAKSFPKTAKRSNGYLLSQGDPLVVERLEFFRAAIHILPFKYKVGGAMIKEIEEAPTSRKWSEHFVKKFHKEIEAVHKGQNGISISLLGSHIGIVIQHYRDADIRLRQVGKKTRVVEQLPDQAAGVPSVVPWMQGGSLSVSNFRPILRTQIFSVSQLEPVIDEEDQTQVLIQQANVEAERYQEGRGAEATRLPQAQGRIADPEASRPTEDGNVDWQGAEPESARIAPLNKPTRSSRLHAQLGRLRAGLRAIVEHMTVSQPDQDQPTEEQAYRAPEQVEQPAAHLSEAHAPETGKREKGTEEDIDIRHKNEDECAKSAGLGISVHAQGFFRSYSSDQAAEREMLELQRDTAQKGQEGERKKVLAELKTTQDQAAKILADLEAEKKKTQILETQLAALEDERNEYDEELGKLSRANTRLEGLVVSLNKRVEEFGVMPVARTAIRLVM